MRYLKPEEFGKCRGLWREAFPEDSLPFVSYYFEKKLPKSRVAVKEDAAGEILSMVHLNPYELRIGEERRRLDYLVGVATRTDWRHRGCMRELLTGILRDKQAEGEPFCYLMPASPDIYAPFAFAWIFDQPLWRPDPRGFAELARRGLALEDGGESAGTDERLARWMNQWLSQRYQVYAERSPSYVKLLRAELASEAGELWEWLDSSGETAALQAVWGREKREQRLLYCGDSSRVQKEGPDRPAIMARITNLEEALRPLRLKEECSLSQMEAELLIHDELLPEHEGRWLWSLDHRGSTLRRLERAGTPEPDRERAERGVLELPVSELTSWMFGYCGLSRETAPDWTERIQTLKGVFLDEVV